MKFYRKTAFRELALAVALSGALICVTFPKHAPEHEPISPSAVKLENPARKPGSAPEKGKIISRADFDRFNSAEDVEFRAFDLGFKVSRSPDGLTYLTEDFGTTRSHNIIDFKRLNEAVGADTEKWKPVIVPLSMREPGWSDDTLMFFIFYPEHGIALSVFKRPMGDAAGTAVSRPVKTKGWNPEAKINIDHTGYFATVQSGKDVMVIGFDDGVVKNYSVPPGKGRVLVDYCDDKLYALNVRENKLHIISEGGRTSLGLHAGDPDRLLVRTYRGGTLVGILKHGSLGHYALPELTRFVQPPLE